MTNVQEAFKTWYKSKYYKYDLYPKYHQFRVEVEDAYIQGYKAALSEVEASSTGISNNAIEQCEPVGYLCESPDKVARIFVDKPLAIHNHTNTPLYTSPQPREWVDLSDSEWVNIVNHDHGYENFSKDDAVHEAVKMTEIKLKQLNTKG